MAAGPLNFRIRKRARFGILTNNAIVRQAAEGYMLSQFFCVAALRPRSSWHCAVCLLLIGVSARACLPQRNSIEVNGLAGKRIGKAGVMNRDSPPRVDDRGAGILDPGDGQ